MSLVTKDQSVISSMNWLLTEKNCFRSEQPDEEMKAFYNETKKLVASKTSGLSAEEMNAIGNTAAYNFLLLLTNCALYFENQQKNKILSGKKSTEKISFVTTEVDCDKACEYLKNNIYTDEMIEYYTRFENARVTKAIQKPITRILFRIFVCILIITLLAGAGLWLSGFFVNPEGDAPTFKNVFDQIGYWFHYDFLGNEKPISAAQQWITTSHEIGHITLIVLCIVFAISLFGLIITTIISKHKQRTIQRWNAITNVFAKFACAAEETKKWEDLF